MSLFFDRPAFLVSGLSLALQMTTFGDVGAGAKTMLHV